MLSCLFTRLRNVAKKEVPAKLKRIANLQQISLIIYWVRFFKVTSISKRRNDPSTGFTAAQTFQAVASSRWSRTSAGQRRGVIKIPEMREQKRFSSYQRLKMLISVPLNVFFICTIAFILYGLCFSMPLNFNIFSTKLWVV